MIEFKIASSRTLRENPSSDWRKEWNMDTFLKALEEVYSVEPADRFMETGSIWQAIALDLCKNLEVDPETEKKLLYPIREVDKHQTLKNLLYTFVARDNPAKDSRSNRTFHSEFQQALTDDPDKIWIIGTCTHLHQHLKLIRFVQPILVDPRHSLYVSLSLQPFDSL